MFKVVYIGKRVSTLITIMADAQMFILYVSFKVAGVGAHVVAPITFELFLVHSLFVGHNRGFRALTIGKVDLKNLKNKLNSIIYYSPPYCCCLPCD